MIRALIFILFCLGSGSLMAAFILSPGVTRYIFSLGALLVGIRFFRQFESLGLRIGFMVMVVILSLFLTTLYVLLAHWNGWYVDPKFLGNVEG